MDANCEIDIDSDIDSVFAIVSDMEQAQRWQPDITRIECVERDAAGRATLVDLELSTVIRTAGARIRFAYEQPHSVTWVMERGDVKSFDGSWTLSVVDATTTRARYEVRIDFGGRLGMLMRGPVAKAANAAAASSMPRKLKAYVESGHAAR